MATWRWCIDIGMEALEFKPDAQPICPNSLCEAKLDGIASDYVLPTGTSGEEHTCGDCDGRFLAAHQKDGLIRFELIEEDDDDGNA